MFWNWLDNWSGIDPGRCPTSSTTSRQGHPVTLTATCTDKAGNTGSASYRVNLDTIAPVVVVTAPTATFTKRQLITVSWVTRDSGSGVISTAVRYARSRAGAAAMSPWVQPTGWTALTTPRLAVTGATGYRYCFQARSRDLAGNISAWSLPRCTTVPLDDWALTASAGWSRGSLSGWLASTYTATAARGLGQQPPVVPVRDATVHQHLLQTRGSGVHRDVGDL